MQHHQRGVHKKLELECYMFFHEIAKSINSWYTSWIKFTYTIVVLHLCLQPKKNDTKGNNTIMVSFLSHLHNKIQLLSPMISFLIQKWHKAFHECTNNWNNCSVIWKTRCNNIFLTLVTYRNSNSTWKKGMAIYVRVSYIWPWE